MSNSFALGWRQVAVCFMLLAATGMIAMTYSLVAVPLAREYNPSRMVLMLSMTIMSGVSALLMPLFGHLMDKYSVRKLMILGGVLLGSGYAAISLTTSFEQVLLIFGVLIAPANVLIGPVSATVLLSRWFSEKRGRAVGIAIAGIAAGGFVYPMIIQSLLDAHQWRTALQLLGLVLVVWTIPMALLVVDRPEERGLHPDGAAKRPGMARAEMSMGPISARQILTDPAFWMIVVTVAIVTSGLKGMITNLAPMALDYGIQASDAAVLVSLYAASSFIAKLSFAALADRLAPRTLMFFALAGFSMTMLCLTQASGGYLVILAGVCLAGLLGGLMVPMESYLTPRVFGLHAVGKAMGLLAGVILVALLCTPPLFGLIFDLTGSYAGIFWTFSGLAAGALLWVPLIRLSPREVPASSPASAG